MKLRYLCALAALLLKLLWWAPVAGATPFVFTFTAVPSAAITGNPGDLVGWGYQLVNTDTLNWFVPTQLNASSFSIGSPDASYFDFPVLAPGATASAAFDAATHTGLYGLQIFPFALPATSDNGSFSLSGEWWSGDPLAGGTFLQVSDVLLAPLSVAVAATAIPAPGSMWLLAVGLPLLWLAQRRRQKGEQFGRALR
ncbi:hypothetical protein Jab_2c25120 [Janthinobacterium sp. HH01]|uniref:hypothetical protein n=1 Tax=Janthinobacterium sp. HH01 TaxID=1198452 RepID=UPI0002AE82B8|nr:hypothetical protein [Janthinobacterium sp. HH01]ELX10423.1 hypothetical protein Jab_2c25120 [Janthinobacterium sp. HH01]